MKRNTNDPPYTSLFLCVVGISLCMAVSAAAQDAEQTFLLQPGWNAVFLEVEPSDRSPEVVFHGLPVESVWMWNPPISFVQYIQNPNELKPDDPEWLVWFPPTQPHSKLLTNLFAIFGERAYLIKITGTVTVPWTIVGTPKLPRIRWQPNSPNLVGFHLMPGQEPTFAAFFTPSAAHGNAAPEVYRLNSVGEWEAVNPTDPMQHGEAYWVQCGTASEYTGPLTVTVVGGGVDFGKMAVEQSLALHNHSAAPITVSVTPQGPATPVAGLVPLSYWVTPSDSGQNPDSVGWQILSGTVSLAYDAGETNNLRLAVRRTALPGQGVYQSLLEITNNAGMRILVLVRTGEQTLDAAATGSSRATTDGPPDYKGLWVGFASITAVNQPADSNDPDTPKPAGSEFVFRLIMHVDESGQVSLLREVVQLWNTKTNSLALFTDDANLAAAISSGNYTGTGMRDGHAVGRRISSAVFSFPDPLVLTGSFDEDSTLTGAYTIAPTDPLNPFLHRYHPDHDNKDADFQNITSAQNFEAPAITRELTLSFQADDPTNMSLAQAGWGDTAMGGTYQEIMSGVHKNTLSMQGDFRLQKISDVGQLNDGP